MGRTVFRGRAALGLAAALGTIAGASGRAEAAFTFIMQQSGSNVVVTGGGTFNPFDLPDPVPVVPAPSGAYVEPQEGTIAVGGDQLDEQLLAVAHHVGAGDARLARGGQHARREDPDGGRLSRAVRPEQAEALAGLDLEVEPGECDDLARGRRRPARRSAPARAAQRR